MNNPEFKTSLHLLENYVFRIDFDEYGYILTDEPPPLGEGEGPNPARLVAAAVANCLSASLLFALRKKKQEPKGLKAEAVGALHRVDGLWRIKSIDVTLNLDTDGIQDGLLKEALAVFEDFCIVTQSIRDGIPISMQVKDMNGGSLTP